MRWTSEYSTLPSLADIWLTGLVAYINYGER